MNAAGHPTRHRREYRESADDCCLPGPSSLGAGGVLGRGAAPGNTTRGVLLFSRPFIPVRKNYLTRRAGARGLTRKRKVVS